MRLLNNTNDPLPQLPEREPDSHKGDFGRALLVGGSRGMSGAIALTGVATLRSGAGLVTLAVPKCVQSIVAAVEPSYMTSALTDDGERIDASAVEQINSLAAGMSALALGPGLGRSDKLNDLVERLYREIKQPIVVDADALFALAERSAALGEPGGVRVLTPHPGEFARLACLEANDADSLAADDESRIQAAAELASRDSSNRTIVVLKGRHTVVTDGNRVSVNQTGNPGMATGGCGDVLTGIITGLMCQGLLPWDAARLGVYVHGLAGDLAGSDFGQTSMIASDLADYLPIAFQSLGD